VDSRSWRDFSPEQAREESRVEELDGPDEDYPPQSGISKLFWLTSIGLAALFGYARSRSPDARPGPEDEALWREYEESLRSHLRALRRVQRHAEKSALAAAEELKALTRAPREPD
jgi:hypothetical protein